VPASAHPYTQYTYYNDPEGSMKSTGLPGEHHKIGSTHEQQYNKAEVVSPSELPDGLVPSFEVDFIKTVSTDADGNTVTIYQGERTRITKTGTGSYCTAGVSFKAEYFDRRGNLIKLVPPEAYNCSFTEHYVTTNNNYNLTFADMVANTSNTVFTQSLSSYDTDLYDRSFTVKFKEAAYTFPPRPPVNIGGGFQPSDVYCYDNNWNIIPCNNPNGCDNKMRDQTASGPPLTTEEFCDDNQAAFFQQGATYEPTAPSGLNTTDMAPEDGTETAFQGDLEYGQWGFKFDLILEADDGGGYTTISQKEMRMVLESEYFTGHRMYVTGYYEYNLASSDDIANPFNNAASFNLPEDIDQYTSIRLRVANFQEAENFSTGVNFNSHTFGAVSSGTYAMNFLDKIKLGTTLTEQDEISEPITYQNVFQYEYTSLNQLKRSYSPDAGISRYIYDNKGRLRFSQNADQANTGNFNYINYDYLGRVVETGVYILPETSGSRIIFALDDELPTLNPGDQYAMDIADLADGLPDGDCAQRSFFEYDNPTNDLPSGLSSSLYEQTFVDGRLVKSWNSERTTWYGYDIEGRQKWEVQELAGLGTKTQYFYYNQDNTLSEMVYQREVTAERLHHHYVYNSNRQLEEVVTTTNGSSGSVERAAYHYYNHGPLKREEIGDNIQGLDYVYTIGGQLKFINDPHLNAYDPGQDGEKGWNREMGYDLFGMSLSYHTGDYNRNRDHYEEGSLNSNYNGLVAAQSWQTATPGSLGMEYEDKILAYHYQYDSEGQLTQADFKTAVHNGSGFTSTAQSDYATRYSYDLNGNLTALKREGYLVDGYDMDDLTFSYPTLGNGQKSSNKLLQVSDAITSDSYTTDISHQSSTNNYSYNETGQLIANAAEDVSYEYNALGLVSIIREQSSGDKLFSYTYNEAGQRQSQVAYNSNEDPSQASYYVYGSGGQVLAIHKATIASGSITGYPIAEQPVYGGSRLGMIDKQDNDASYYEIKDHLGNVRLVLADREGDGLTNYAFTFDAAEQEQVPITNQSPATHNITGDRLEVTVSEYHKGILFTVPLEANRQYRFKADYGVISGTDNYYFRAYHINSATWVSPYHYLDPGTNEIVFTTTQAGDYRLFIRNVFTPDPTASFWLDEVYIHEIPDIISATDYYPFGMEMPGRTYVSSFGSYRYAYQGDFAEKDMNGLSNFQLRQFDSRIGRWLVPDPMGQYVSAYLGMGNNPVSLTDPTGGFSIPTDEQMHYAQMNGPGDWYVEGDVPSFISNNGLSAAYSSRNSMREDLAATIGEITLLANLSGNSSEENIWGDIYANAISKLGRLTKGLGLEGLSYSKKHNGWGVWEDTQTEVIVAPGQSDGKGNLPNQEVITTFTKYYNVDEIIWEGARPRYGFVDGVVDGVKAGGKSTLNFVKSLGTSQGWKDIGLGLAQVGLMMSPSPAGMFHRANSAMEVESYIRNTPNMTAYEWGYDVGFASEKALEIAVTRNIYSGAGVGLGNVRLLSNTTIRGTTLFKTGKNFRIDLDIRNGLHYHRRGPGGIGRHRPWQVKPGDKGDFLKRF